MFAFNVILNNKTGCFFTVRNKKTTKYKLNVINIKHSAQQRNSLQVKDCFVTSSLQLKYAK